MRSLCYLVWLVTSLLTIRLADARDVFAHYMLGSVTKEHVEQDIDDAIAMGLDAFSINVGYPQAEHVFPSLVLLFDHADDLKARGGNFRLFISMDLWAAGDVKHSDGTNVNAYDYGDTFRDFITRPSYYLGPNGKPFVTTFSDGGMDGPAFQGWRDTLSKTGVYFVPDLDHTLGFNTSHPEWWRYWGPVFDGVTAWETAWPYRAGYGGYWPGDTRWDKQVIDGIDGNPGTLAHGKTYMMPMSSIQYKNAYETNVYREGGLNLVQRMKETLAMPNGPDFIQIITWNDGPESHYIGNIWPEQNIDADPSLYMSSTKGNHKAWQPLIHSFIIAFKQRARDISQMALPPGTGTHFVGAIWYKQVLSAADCSDVKAVKPDGYATAKDRLTWAVVVDGSATFSVSYGTEDVKLAVGLNFGEFDLKEGPQRVVLRSNGAVVGTASGGACTHTWCPDKIYNLNVEVVPFVTKSAPDIVCREPLSEAEKCLALDRTFSEVNSDREGEYMRWLVMEPEYAATTGRTYITIVNLTPHRFTLDEYRHSYQMDEFNWADIPPGKSRQNVAHHTGRVGADPKTTNGEVFYSIGNTGLKFEVRATTHIPDIYPRRVVFDLTQMGMGQREYKVPEQEVPVTLVITGSATYGFITSLSHGPGNWMNNIKDVIKDRKLRHVIMPGTHDSGMSKITLAIESFGTSSNTQTQGLNIYDQLRTGARWFDLRVQSVHNVLSLSSYRFWTTHINDELSNTPVGASGEAFDQVINEINRFTDENHGEVIFLQLRYLNGIRELPSISPIPWDRDIMSEFVRKLRLIKRRCPRMGTGFQDRKIGEFMDMNNGEGCVLIFLNTRNLQKAGISLATLSIDGIYSNDDIRFTDAWPNKEDTEEVANRSISLWQSKKEFHVAQWLVTPNPLTSTLVYSLQSIAILPTNPALYWKGVNSITPTIFPNVLMVDYIGMVLMNAPGWNELSAEMYTLAIGLNLYTISENCDINERRSPLLSSNKGMRIANKKKPFGSTWNGIIFANGTKIDHPPPTLHVGRVEILQNGTIFGNGTVIEEDRLNPYFDSTLEFHEGSFSNSSQKNAPRNTWEQGRTKDLSNDYSRR